MVAVRRVLEVPHSCREYVTLHGLGGRMLPPAWGKANEWAYGRFLFNSSETEAISGQRAAEGTYPCQFSSKRSR